MKKPEDLLYNWIFHYNYHTQTWNAFPRDQHTKYFNGAADTLVKEDTINKCIKEAARIELDRIKNV